MQTKKTSIDEQTNFQAIIDSAININEYAKKKKKVTTNKQ